MATEPTPQTVVILGAGVIGLTIAHVLSSQAPNAYKITIVARDLPGDFDSQAWASPWAGANWADMEYGASDERIKQWETVTVNKLWDMLPTGLVKKLPSRVYSVDSDRGYSDPWFKGIAREFKVQTPDELPSGYKFGAKYTTVSINPLTYIPWLKSELDARGVTFVRKRVRSIEEVADMAGPNGIVVNASSLGARSLIGVLDTKMHPVRGQTILVHAPYIHEFVADHTVRSNGLFSYVIPRPGGDGTVILGGTSQPNNWDTSYDEQTAQEILVGCASFIPEILDPEKTKILSHNVGLRPTREDGPRVEVEWMKFPLEGHLVPRIADTKERTVKVVHAYGFGGHGYQGSWGVAEDVVKLIRSEGK